MAGLKWWFSFVLLLACSTQAQEKNILFIGNSYTYMNDLPGMVKKLAGSQNKQVNVEAITVGGSNLKGHASRTATYEKIASQQWDAVIFQGHSREMTYDTAIINYNTLPYLQQMMDSVKRLSPCANYYLFLTWGYKEGHQDSLPNDSYGLMQQRVERGYRFVQQKIGQLEILPVGLVWDKIIAQHPEIELYDPDKSHPNKAGTYAAAATIEQQLLGIQPNLVYFPAEVGDSLALVIKSFSDAYINTHSTPKKVEEFPSTLSVEKHKKKVSIILDNALSPGSELSFNFSKNKWTTKNKHRYYRKGTKTIKILVQTQCEEYLKEIQLQID